MHAPGKAVTLPNIGVPHYIGVPPPTYLPTRVPGRSSDARSLLLVALDEKDHAIGHPMHRAR